MAAYGALVSLKQDLKRVLPSYRSFDQLPLTKQDLQAIPKEADLVDLLLMDALGRQYFNSQVRDVVVVVRKGLVKLCRDMEFQKHHESAKLMESLLMDSMGGSYTQSEVKDVVDSMQLDAGGTDTPFCIEEFGKLYLNVIRMDSLLSISLTKSYGQSRIRETVFAIQTNLEKWIELLSSQVLQKLSDRLDFMESLLTSGDHYNPEMMALFQNPIRDAAHKASNHVHFKGQEEVFVQFDESDSSSSTLTKVGRTVDDHTFGLSVLTEVTKEMACLNVELEKQGKQASGIAAPQNLEYPVPSADESSSCPTPPQRGSNKDGKLVGLEKDLQDMFSQLTEPSKALKVCTVVGMAGIGKTTFVKELHDHPSLASHFDVRAWVTVSQEFQPSKIFLDLLTDMQYHPNENESFGDQLYKKLFGRRYLITIDDVWDKTALYVLRRFLPDGGEGSRVMLTTRHQDVATDASPNIKPHHLQSLSPQQSFELLCSKIFVNESCPLELSPIGMKIASQCRGLPLAIIVVAGILSKLKRPEAWKEVAQNVESRVMDNPEYCQSILALSYNHLPNPLKACFLYMGVFPEDYSISSKKLKCIWIAEGFVQSNEQKPLEQIAEDYLKDLVARSLVMVKSNGSNGRIKICYIHDLLRDLCVRESQNENFFHFIHPSRNFSQRDAAGDEANEEFHEIDLHNVPRLAIHSNFREYMQVRSSFPYIRTFVCFESVRQVDLKGCSGIFLKVLKVLDIMHVQLLSLPPGVLLLSNLKYMALTIENSFLLSELFKLQSLQTCIIDGKGIGSLSTEFWNMSELRHFQLKRFLPNVDYSAENSKSYLTSDVKVLKNLQSLSTVGPETCTKEIFLSMPNLKKLGVYQDEDDFQFIDWFNNLIYLNKLETLKYAFLIPFGRSRVRPEVLPACDVLLPNLKKLTLRGTALPWGEMDKLSKLPKLEVLKLKNFAFLGQTWKLEESIFNDLKFLLIGSTNLEGWEANYFNFPSLQHLVLQHCKELKEIPCDICDGPLAKIEVHGCNDSAAESARELQKEQHENGNDDFVVYIT